MRAPSRLVLLAVALTVALAGCAAVNGADSGVYAGGDVSAHKDFR